MEKQKPVTLLFLCFLSLLAGCRKAPADPGASKRLAFTAVVSNDLPPWKSGMEISISDNFGHTALYGTQSDGHEVPLSFISGDALKKGNGVVFRASYPPSADIEGLAVWQELAPDSQPKERPLQARGSGTVLSFYPTSGCVRLSFEGSVPVTAVVSFDKGDIHLSVPDGTASGLFWMPEGDYRLERVGMVRPDRKIASREYSVDLAISGQNPVEIIVPETEFSATDTHLTGNARTANCYIAAPDRSARFYAGCAGNLGLMERSFTPAYADILWQDGVLYPVLCDGEYIYFHTNGKEGNALVAARDRDGSILWSWHIWICSSQPASVKTTAGAIMDRNLGASSAAPGIAGSSGLYYQWGRKDPFRGEPDTEEAADAAYAVRHPDVFLTGSVQSCFDWLTPPDNQRWNGASKTLDDPCPDGWRIPEGGGHGVSSTTLSVSKPVLTGLWNLAAGSSLPSYGSPHFQSPASGIPGLMFPDTSSWFPASGWLDGGSGTRTGFSEAGSCWTAGCAGSQSYCLVFARSGYFSPASFSTRASGRNVRCIKE